MVEWGLPGECTQRRDPHALGQPEQKTVAQDSSTAAPARRSQLVHRPPAPTPKAAPPKTQIPVARDDGTRPSPGVAASTVKTRPSALASVTLEQSAEENADSPSIYQAMVRNSDVPEVDGQALGARSPVRVVWPLAVSEIPPEAAGTTVAAKNESVQLVRPEAHVETTRQAESSIQPREGDDRTAARNAIDDAPFSRDWAPVGRRSRLARDNS